MMKIHGLTDGAYYAIQVCAIASFVKLLWAAPAAFKGG